MYEIRKDLEIIRNESGAIIGLLGLLPDGTYGMCFDTVCPFTEEELNNTFLFSIHREELARRMNI